jgi:hypothetical protein
MKDTLFLIVKVVTADLDHTKSLFGFALFNGVKPTFSVLRFSWILIVNNKSIVSPTAFQHLLEFLRCSSARWTAITIGFQDMLSDANHYSIRS